MKKKTVIIGLVVIALGVAAYFIFFKKKNEETGSENQGE